MVRLRSLRASLAAVAVYAVLPAGILFAQETPPPAEKKEEPAVTNEAVAAASPTIESNGPPIVFHGEVRMRYESWKNASDFSNTSSQATDDTFDIAPWRLRLGALADLGHGITARAELQGTGAWGSTSADGGNEQTRAFFGSQIDPGTDVDLYQGWVRLHDLCDTTTDLTFGRQEIAFDRGLHFSSEPYYNGIVHDAVVASWDLERTTIHGFWTRAQEVDTFGLTSHGDDEILGVHFRQGIAKSEESETAFSYYLFHELERADPIGGRTSITTLGALFGRSIDGGSGLTWSVEGAWQEGDIETATTGLDHEAYVLEAQVGFFTDKSGNDRRFWVGLYTASGDGDPTDARQEAFDPLYEEVHFRLGDSDIAPLTNLMAYHVGLDFGFRDNHSLRAEFFQFARRKDEQASISPISGVTLASPCVGGSAGNCSTDLGRELDVDYRYRATENLSLGLAWAYFIPGSAIEDEFGTPGSTSTGEHAAQRVVLQIRARF